MDPEKLDRLETNFRLSLISQREQSAKLRELADKVNGLTSVLGEVATGLATVAEKSEQTADRLEDSIQVMMSFAESQTEIRKILTDYGCRLDALEGKAS